MGENKQLHFSQGSLQDFVECERRYYYRNRLRLAWPAAEMEPISEFERFQKLGKDFHLLVQQYLSRVPGEVVARQASIDQDLAVWWKHFVEFGVAELPGEKYPEISIRLPFDGVLLTAKFDLLLLSPDGQATIYDWKTSRRRPDRYDLASRWQSILYPYLLAEGGEVFQRGREVSPDSITMVYWFTNYPEEPVKLEYSAQLHKDHGKVIESIVETIRSKTELDEFPLTSDEIRCKYCVYRSLCNRGVKAGGEYMGEEKPSLDDFDLDIDQIQEIEL